MHSKIEITDLPITEEFLSQKRLIQERGELALIEDGEEFHHLAYFSLLKGKGYRGGHYHLNKHERFYIISGKISLDCVDVHTHEKENFTLYTGQKVMIYPGIAHRFESLEDAQVIEYYSGVYDKVDEFPFRNF